MKSGDMEAIEFEMVRLGRISELVLHGPFMEEWSGFSGGKEAQLFMIEFPTMLDHTLRRTLEHKTANPGPLGAPRPTRISAREKLPGK
jgi:hypothetical protein